eukprot:m.89188 g.89188  ORF g.89188 m.89188 type:complete len:327 (+) comp9789_c0_seq1:273-1253(+)
MEMPREVFRWVRLNQFNENAPPKSKVKVFFMEDLECEFKPGKFRRKGKNGFSTFTPANGGLDELDLRHISADTAKDELERRFQGDNGSNFFAPCNQGELDAMQQKHAWLDTSRNRINVKPKALQRKGLKMDLGGTTVIFVTFVFGLDPQSLMEGYELNPNDKDHGAWQHHTLMPPMAWTDGPNDTEEVGSFDIVVPLGSIQHLPWHLRGIYLRGAAEPRPPARGEDDDCFKLALVLYSHAEATSCTELQMKALDLSTKLGTIKYPRLGELCSLLTSLELGAIVTILDDIMTSCDPFDLESIGMLHATLKDSVGCVASDADQGGATA